MARSRARANTRRTKTADVTIVNAVADRSHRDGSTADLRELWRGRETHFACSIALAWRLALPEVRRS